MDAKRVGTLAVAIAGLAIGIGAGWWRAGAGPEPTGLEQRMAAALRMVDPVERRREVAAVLAELRPETLPAIRAGILSESRYADRCVLAPYASAWAAFDPEGAFEAAGSDWTLALKQIPMYEAIAYRLARTGQVEHARSLAAKLTVARVHRPTTTAIVAGLVRAGELEDATALLIESSREYARVRMAEQILRSFLLRRDPDGLIAWAEAFPSDAPHGLGGEIIQQAARWLASVEPTRAAAWLDARADQDERAVDARVNVAEEWIEHDPEAALRWITERTTPGERDLVMRRVLERFVKLSPGKAAAWMSRQQPLGDAAVAIPNLVAALSASDPAEALAWASRSPEAERRDQMTTSTLRSWLVREPEAARAWLAENEISEKVQRALETGDPDADGEAR